MRTGNTNSVVGAVVDRPLLCAVIALLLILLPIYLSIQKPAAAETCRLGTQGSTAGSVHVYSSGASGILPQAMSADEIVETRLQSKLAGYGMMQAIEEDTGEIVPALLERFKVASSERLEVKNLIKKAVADFKSIEVERAVVVSSPTERYIQLNSCDDLSGKIFRQLIEDLEALLDKDRAEAIATTLGRQLRNGGRDTMQVSLVALENGQFLLSKRIFEPNGTEKSFDESEYLVGASFSEFSRWQNLDNVK